ncbi:hypothetical protein BD310DRAFT_823001 [Dichomitus squalens]|uniref:Uncharacterized protein n=1 Tax=Dichomitus squalens TaxID=114155 RepID=A0A4Q9PQX2_9APHY|nr:hypothetical protein BD310DRAFT_823001 [Dichomitus squalens]
MATDGTAAPVDNPHLHNPTPIDQPALQWDGDRMFNIYIYDYCIKRGFRRTASELQQEASIPATAQPPINAKQGLLFEWWSVFWVLFTAKSNGAGPEEALLYTQHQQQVQAAAQKPQARPGQPGAAHPVRFPNGVQRPPNPTVAPPNGIVAPSGQQPGPPPNGTQNAVPFPANGPQPNGVPGSSGGPAPPQGPTMPQAPPPNQRTGPPQQRLNGGPFQSPQMAHSPPNTQPGGPPPHNPMAPVGQNQPLTQMRGTMHPPNGPPGPQQTPQPGYQAFVGRSPNNPGSPAVHQSPSMAHRQVPGMAGLQPMSPEMLTQELNRIPPPSLHKLRQDLGMGDKDITTMTTEEKQALVSQFRRGGNMKPPNAPGPSNAPPGHPGPGPMQPPSGLRAMSHPQNGQQSGQQPLQPSQGQNQQQRGAKRNSTSPGQEAEQLPSARNESSPRENKRVRRSPAEGHAQPPMTPMYPPQHPPQQPGPPGQPMQLPNGMMQRPAQMQGMQYNGPPMAGMNNPMLGHGLGTPQMSPMQTPMNPPMMQPGQSGMVNPAMHQYRQQMQNIHKPPNMPQHMMPSNAASPAADGQGGQPGNRMAQGKPMGMMPPPPPSPAMAAKNPPGGSKQEDGAPQNGRVDSSPQNAAAGMPGQNHSGVPPQTTTPAPPTPNASGSGQMTAPSPSQILSSSTPQMSNHPPPQMSNHHPPPPPPPATNPADALDPSAFNVDFPFGDFDVTGGLMGDSSLNFERDFAAWFDPENAA